MKRVAVAALLLSLAVPATAQAEDFNFDTSTVYKSSYRLGSQQWYILTAQGTASYHKPSVWSHPRQIFKTSPGTRQAIVCGTPEAAPMFGPAAGPVGFDAETMFSRPVAKETCATDPGPRTTRRFEFNDGLDWFHSVPLDGRHTTPLPDHKYSYAVVGRGTYWQLRIRDTPRTDNYGVLKISFRPANAGDCVNRQWRNFRNSWNSPAFADEAQCFARFGGVSAT